MRSLITLFTFILLCASSHGQRTTNGMYYSSSVMPKTKCTLTLSSAFEELPSFGYYPVTVTLRNDGNKARTFKLSSESTADFDSYSYRRQNQESKVVSSFTLSCEPGKSASYTLNVPIVQGFSGLSRDEYSYYSSSSSSSSPSGDYNRNDLTFTVEDGDFYHNVTGDVYTDRMHTAISGMAQSAWSSAHNIENACSSFDPALLPTGTSGLAGYDCLVLNFSEWETLTELQQGSLMQWCRAGGRLILLSETPKQVVKAMERRTGTKFSDTRQGFFSPYHVGTVSIYNTLLDSATSDDGLNAMMTQNPHQMAKHLNHAYHSQYDWSLAEEFGSKGFGEGLLATILVFFAILVGPINFFVFAKQGKRHRLFITTPVIAAGASLVLLFVILFKDGVGGEGKQMVLKEIDPVGKRVYLQQEQICRTGMLFSGDFMLDDEYSITQVPIPKSRWARLSADSQVGPLSYSQQSSEDGKICSGDYFSSRSEHGHFVQGVSVTQESVSVRKDGEQFYLTSTLADPIETLYYRDEQGQIWLAENLTTGTEVKAAPYGVDQHKQKMTEISRRFTKLLGEQVVSYSQRPNSFVAQAKSGEGVKTHESINWDTTVILTGTCILN